MDRDDILAMKPGRELDALVAEKVMGWEWVEKKWWTGERKKLLFKSNWDMRGDDFDHLDDERILFWDMPQYSEKIEVAWEVLTHVCIQGQVGFSGGSDWFCDIQTGWNDDGTAKWFKTEGHTAPHAISIASLLAVEVEHGQG